MTEALTWAGGIVGGLGLLVLVLGGLRGTFVIYESPGPSPVVRQMLLGLLMMFIGGLLLTAASF